MIFFEILMLLIALFVFFLILYLTKIKLRQLKYWDLIITVFVITVVFLFFVLYKTFFYETINSSNFKILEGFVLLHFCATLAIFINVFTIPIIHKIKEKQIIKKHEEKYKIINYEYYRDIVGNVSPAIIMNVYQRKSNFEDQIIATLLYLHLNGTIKINDKSIQIIKGCKNLLEHEKLIIDYCTSNVNESDFDIELDTAINQDIKKLGYVCTKDSSEASVKDFIGIIMVFNIIYALVSIPVFAAALKLFPLLIISYVLVFVGIPIYESISEKIKLTIRTEKALKLCAKLNGLKRFIKDFSIINNRRLQEIELYEDYIIYGIVFNLKGKLNDDAKRMYKKIQNKIFYKNNSIL